MGLIVYLCAKKHSDPHICHCPCRWCWSWCCCGSAGSLQHFHCSLQGGACSCWAHYQQWKSHTQRSVSVLPSPALKTHIPWFREGQLYSLRDIGSHGQVGMIYYSFSFSSVSLEIIWLCVYSLLLLAVQWFVHALRIPAVWCFSPSLGECHVFQYVPPSQSWAYWAALLDERCGHCPARSLHGWIQIHFCTASSHGWKMSDRSYVFESESSPLHLSPYHRKPGSSYQNVIECREKEKSTLYQKVYREDMLYTRLKCNIRSAQGYPESHL